MSDTGTKPDPKPPPEKPKLTNRSAGLIVLTVFGGAAAIGLFSLFGPLAAAAVPVAAVGAGYTRHRMKHPKRRKTGGSLPWPFTGNQSRRALSRIGFGSRKSAGGKGGPTGAKSRKSQSRGTTGLLPTGASRGFRSRTTRSRAAAGAGGVLPKHKGRRSVPSRTTAKPAPFAGARPKGTRAPKTGSRTPARPAMSPRLTGPKRGASTSPKGSTPGRSSTHRRPNLRLLQGGKSSKPGRSGSLRSTPKATPSGRRKTSPMRRFSGTASRLGRTISPFRTSPSGRHRRLKSPFRRTSSTLPSKRSSKRATGRDRVPFRTSKRPVPYKRIRAHALWRLALGIPSLKGNKLVGISAAKRARARRTLRLRSLARLWAVRRFPGFLGRLPARFGRWHWDRIWSAVPRPPKPEHEWLTAAPRPKAVAAPGPRYVVPVPSPSRSEAPMSSNPQQMIIEAFAQLAAFRTESASEFERHLAADSEMWAQVSQSIVTFADSVQSSMPYGPATCDGLRDLGSAALALGQISQQVHVVFRSEHEEKLQRIENPLADEKQWDVGGGVQS